ncbi:MAG: DUF6599 family protein [Bryobacteraceae bacterium]
MFLRAACSFVVLFGAVQCQAGIWPDQIGKFQRKPVQTLAVGDQALLHEFGFEATEQAEYSDGASKFTATAWRLNDSTGALAMFEFRRPPGAKPAPVTKLAVTTDDGVLLAFGNYVLQFTGHSPTIPEMNYIIQELPRLEQSSLPVLMTYLPPGGLIPNSERYVVGPVSLQRTDPRISPSLVAFHLGAEGQFGKYHVADPNGVPGSGHDLELAIFSYPTPSMARERTEEFRKLPGAMVKRTGSLVALILSPPNADAAERLLAKVNHQISLTIHETPNETKAKGFLGMVGNAAIFSFVMMGFCVVVGIFLGGLTVLRRRFGKKDAEQAMITLGLDGK